MALHCLNVVGGLSPASQVGPNSFDGCWCDPWSSTLTFCACYELCSSLIDTVGASFCLAFACGIFTVPDKLGSFMMDTCGAIYLVTVGGLSPAALMAMCDIWLLL